MHKNAQWLAPLLLNCSNIKFTILIIFECTVQWHTIEFTFLLSPDLGDIILLSESRNLTLPGSACKCSHTLFVLLCLAPFTLTHLFEDWVFIARRLCRGGDGICSSEPQFPWGPLHMAGPLNLKASA